MTASRAFQALEKIITARRAQGLPAGWQFRDIHGNTLLHYAATSGDTQAITRLLKEKDADINVFTLALPKKTPIMLALENGQLEAAKILFNHNAACYNVKMADIRESACRKWITQKIYTDLVIHLEKKSARPQCRFIKPIEDGTLNISAVLQRCAEIDALELVIKVNKQQSYALQNILLELVVANPIRKDASTDGLLVIACANGSMQMLQMLIDMNQRFLKAEKPYRETPLQAAAKYNQISVMKYLLSISVDVNKQGKYKMTALHSAIIAKNSEVVEFLLAQHAGINRVNIHGRNELHEACMAGDITIFKLLFQQTGCVHLLQAADIYGRTPLDYALMYGHDEIIARLSTDEQFKNIKKMPEYNCPPIHIDHRSVLLRMFYFLQLESRDTDALFHCHGHCHGFEFLAEIYPLDYCISTYKLIMKWNGSTALLKKPLLKVQQAQFYGNRAELMDQWIQTIVWFQHNESVIANVTGINQHQRCEQYAVVAPNADSSYIQLSEFGSTTKCSHDEIKEILYIFSLLPESTRLRFSGAFHSTVAKILPNDRIEYYDSNYPSATTPVTDSEELFERIFNFKYVYLDHLTNALAHTNLEIGFHLGCFSENYAAYQKNVDAKFRDSPKFALPNSKQEANRQHDTSPCRFTLAHIAVLTRNIQLLQRVVDNNFINLLHKDVWHMTALQYALDNKLDDHVQLILTESRIDLSNSAEICRAYNQKNEAAVDLLFQSERTSNLFDLLRDAVIQEDLSMVKRIFENGKIDTDQSQNPLLLKSLMMAIGNENPEITQYLLLNKLDLYATIDHTSTPLSALARSRTSFFVLLDTTKGIDINRLDNLGYGLIHYVAKHGDIDKLEYLIERQADLNLRDINGNTPLLNLINENAQKEALLLLKFGANIYLKNAEGITPQDLMKNLSSRFQLKAKAIIDARVKVSGSSDSLWSTSSVDQQRKKTPSPPKHPAPK